MSMCSCTYGSKGSLALRRGELSIALAAPHDLAHVLGRIPVWQLAATARQVNAVGIDEIGGTVVENISVFFLARAPASASRRDRLDRMRAHEPVAGVYVVQVLLHDLVARQPHEGVPVALLELHVAPLRIALVVGKERAVEKQHRGSFPISI